MCMKCWESDIMVKVYADLIKKGLKTIDDVPAKLRLQVEKELLKQFTRGRYTIDLQAMNWVYQSALGGREAVRKNMKGKQTMKYRDFTKLEIDYLVDMCNFTDEEYQYFILKTKDKSIIQISLEMHISESKVSKLARRVKNKISRVEEK